MPSVSINDTFQPPASAAAASPLDYIHYEKSSTPTSPTIAAWAYGHSLDENVTQLDGIIKNGKNTSLHSLQNGVPSGNAYGRSRTRSRAGSLLSLSNGDGRVMDGERKITDLGDGASKHIPGDGSYTSGQMNGYVVQPNYPKSSNAPVLVNGNHSGLPRSLDKHVPMTNDVPTEATTPIIDGKDTPSQESVAEPYPRSHHYSSPPVLSSPTAAPGTATASGSYFPPAGRLTHRHTLQVPKPSGGRGSREFPPSNANSSDDISGRLSPPATGARRASLSLMRRTTRSIHSDLHLDEVPQDDDAARWTEAIRQKRASRRRRKEEEDDDRVIVGTKVDQNHVNWVTAYNMLTGIRFTVSRTNAKMDRELTDADFEAKHKFSFDITGNELTPSAKYDFKFKDYAPWVFRHLRAKFQLDPADYLMSLTSKYILSELGSPGKSGSFFYFSRDYKYIIKTIHHAEHKLLRRILKDYYNHVENNPNTLISQFYGLHRVKIAYGRKIHFVVMNNLLPPHRDVHQMFDLKGSTIGRDFREEALTDNPRVTLKDLNWLRRNYHLELGPNKKQVFIAQMERDVALLQRLKIMDYSLLVGIHDLTKGNEENLRDKTLQVFQPGGDSANDPQPLTRTPSKLENARKARELREIIKKEKPVPMDQSTSKMPDELLGERKNFIFYSDDGGFQATHEDGRPGEKIYYLGIIDCLTHYGTVKKAEHFWKGLSHDSKQISPIPPEGYGDRFVKFISGITKTPEEAERENEADEQGLVSTDTVRRRHRALSSLSRSSTDKVMERAEKQAQKSADKRPSSEEDIPERALSTARSPSAERSGGIAGTTLPVVEEVGEAGSTGGHSGRSRDSIPAMGNDRRDNRIPPRMDGTIHLVNGDEDGGEKPRQPPPTPPKDRSPRNKQLPPVPHLNSSFNNTTEPISEGREASWQGNMSRRG
ncbi:MAG: Phosphatidylinositol-4-phosphate 5-kinase [Cirrosporium novae-zelandiae]|nr:MAG: Phosphatidylinositol-4-phosphate 5-kinase [Cirrosporium novae-zelandiae]